MTDSERTEPARNESPNSSGFDFNQPTIIALLYLLGFVTGITSFVGIVLAHVWSSDDRQSWAASHYSYHIRTFWFGLLASLIAGLLSLVLIGFLLFPLIAIWVGVRSVLSLIKAQKREPMPNPETLAF